MADPSPSSIDGVNALNVVSHTSPTCSSESNSSVCTIINNNETTNDTIGVHPSSATIKRYYPTFSRHECCAAKAENALWRFTESDFLNSNCFYDDPVEHFSNGELQGSDGLPLRRFCADDSKKARAIVESVINDTPYTAGVHTDGHNSSDTSVHFINSLSSTPSETLVNDSGTEFSVLTMETAQHWKGKSLVRLLFQGVAGEPFNVFGGDDLHGMILNSKGEWIVKNFGKTFVSPHATIDLISSHQLQQNVLGTEFSIDGSAHMYDDLGNVFPLFREGGLWKFHMRISNPKSNYDENLPTAYDSAVNAQENLKTSEENIHVPGAFAAAKCRCCSSNCGDPLTAFRSAASNCCPTQHITGHSPSVINAVAEDQQPDSQFNLNMPQRIANMLSHHCTLNHCSVTVLNDLVRSGEITDGCILKEIKCSSCDIAGMIRNSKSHGRYARLYPDQPFHTVQGDIFDAEDVSCRNGYKYVLGFECVASGKVWTYNMKSKDEALEGFKEFEKYLESIRPFVEKKHNRPIKLSVISFDREGSLTTTYGNMRSVADQYFHDKGYTRIFTSRDSSTVTARIERFWRALKKGVRVSLLESGLKDAFYFDAVHVFVQHYNCLPTDANRIDPGVAPNTTLGLKFSIKRLRPFGAPGTLLVKPTGTVTAPDVPGKFCIFIGYGLDTPGYRVIVPSVGEIKVYTDIDIKISKSVVPCRDFLTKCRLDPTYAAIHGAWFDRVFEIRFEGYGSLVDAVDDSSFVSSPPGNSDLALDYSFPEPHPPVPCHDGAVDEYVGQRIAKIFDDNVYNGVVVSYLPPVESDDVPFWQILYDDGDEEHWNKSEIDTGLQLYALNKAWNPGFDARQTVGTTPQQQSRAGLLPHVPRRKSSDIMTEDDAKDALRTAKRAGSKLKFIPENPKVVGTKSHARYDAYKTCTTFEEFYDLTKRNVLFTDVHGTTSSIQAAVRNDLVNDLCKGYLSIVDAAVLIVQNSVGVNNTSIDSDGNFDRSGHFEDSVGDIVDDSVGDSVGDNKPVDLLNCPVPTKAELELEKILMDIVDNVRNDVATSKEHPSVPSYMVRKIDHVDFDPPGVLEGYLEREDMDNYNKSCSAHLRRFNTIKTGVHRQDVELFDAARTWWNKSCMTSDRKSSHPVEIPAWFALAASQKARVWVEGMAEPIGIVDAMKQPEWEDHWRPAIEKEIMGLILMDLWDEVPIDDVPEGTKIFPGHFVFKLKSEDGRFTRAKARYVFGGHRTSAGVDFFETAAYMAQMKTVRSVLSLAVGDGHRIKNFDIRQAFCFSDTLKPLYMHLPDLGRMGITNPLCGRGKGSGYVAKTKKMLYGQRDASRAWMNLLDKFMHSIGARPTICDRMAYVWNGCRIVVHVDDILASFPTIELENKFEHLLREKFGHDNITVENGKWILGMKIDYDMEKRTLKLSQGAFARKLLDTFDVPHDVNPTKTPFPLNAEFTKFDGQASAHEIYNMMVLCGSLQWLQCGTRLDLSYPAGILARYASNPSPQHIEYGYHVLRYIAGSIDKGITYHGSDKVLNEGYPHRNKLYGSVDADLGGCKDTEKSTSGLILMLNDGPVVWRSTRQSTTSTGTTEAESKAACFIGQQCNWHIDLLTELGHPQPPVRIMEDNRGVVCLAEGTNHGKSGHFRRAVSYYEGLSDRSLLWFDKIPSENNTADTLTKVVAPESTFSELINIAMGETPSLFISRRISDILSMGHVR